VDAKSSFFADGPRVESEWHSKFYVQNITFE